MILEGLILTVIGISGVFIFLIFLIFIIKLTHRVLLKINQYFPEENKTTTLVSISNDEEIAVAIVALKAFWKKRR